MEPQRRDRPLDVTPSVSRSEELASTLRELQTIIDASASPSLVRRIDEELHKIAENQFYIAVFGQFKRGKTTFLNAVLGEELLPVGILPVTSAVTLIRYGAEKRVVVHLADDTKAEIIPSALDGYVSEEKNPRNAKRVRQVEITHPAEILREGMVLVDTPGIGSIHEHNTQVSVEFVPRIDAAILVVSADPPITQAENMLLHDIRKHTREIRIILNKTDLLSPSQRDEILQFTREVVGWSRDDAGLNVVALSALLALKGRLTGNRELVRQSGIEDVESALSDIRRLRNKGFLLDGAVRRTFDFLTGARFEAELELNANQMPLSELKSKIDQFEIHIDRLLRDRTAFEYLLTGEEKSLESWIADEAQRFSREENSSLGSHAFREAQESSGTSVHDVLRAQEEFLGDELRRDFNRWRDRIEPEIVRRFRVISEKYVQHINDSMDGIQKLSAELLGTSPLPQPSIEQLRWPEQISFRIQEDGLFLEFDILPWFARVLPLSIRNRMLWNRLSGQLQERIDQYAGTLRYEYAYRLQELFRQFHAQLDQTIDTVIDQTRSILSRTRARRDRDTENSEPIIQQLRDRMTRLRDLQQRAQEIQ